MASNTASTMWDSVVASAAKAATQAGKATEVAATKAKIHADLMVIDRDIKARQEKFGVEMYAHLEKITSTQEFYTADDRLINIIRPTLIKAQREVAAYERKRETLKGRVSTAEANRGGTASIFTAATIGEKFMNAAKYAAAGAKEAASKTELAMLDRQILGFKEEFGGELYPIFVSMEDNEGWLPTDRKVRSLYDGAREDIADILKSKQEKQAQIDQLNGVEGSGLTPPVVPASSPAPAVIATPVQPTAGGIAQASWATPTVPATAAKTSATDGYGSAQLPPVQIAVSSFGAVAMDQSKQMPPQQQQRQVPGDGGFGVVQTPQPNANALAQPMSASMPQYSNHPAPQQAAPAQHSQNFFDSFDGMAGSSSGAAASMNHSFGAPPAAAAAPPSNAVFDPFSGNAPNNGAGDPQALSKADMDLFKF